MNFAAITKRLPDGRTTIEFPDCPGCQTFAEPNQNVHAVAREALEGWLEAHVLTGREMPEPESVAMMVVAHPKAVWSWIDRWQMYDVPGFGLTIGKLDEAGELVPMTRDYTGPVAFRLTGANGTCIYLSKNVDNLEMARACAVLYLREHLAGLIALLPEG